MKNVDAIIGTGQSGPSMEERFSDAGATAGSQMKIVVVMRRTFLALAVCVVIGVGGKTLAQHTGKGQVKVTQLSQRYIIEKLDGRAASATVREVTFEPGQKDSPHRHTGPVFGYVLEGEYEHAMDDEPVKTYKAGDAFYEPSGSLHRVARNPSGNTRTRLLAVVLHSRDTKEVTVQEGSWGVTHAHPSKSVRLIRAARLLESRRRGEVSARPALSLSCSSTVPYFNRGFTNEDFCCRGNGSDRSSADRPIARQRTHGSRSDPHSRKSSGFGETRC